MTEKCTVKRIKRHTVYIALSRTEKCEGCNICAFNRKKELTVPAVCKIPVKIGDVVEVQMPMRSVGAASLSIYALPLLLMVVGAVIGLVGQWWLQLMLGAVGIVSGLLGACAIDRAYRKKSGVLPTVLSIVDGDTAAKTDNSESETSEQNTKSGV